MANHIVYSAPGHYTDYFDALDGDVKKVTNVDRSVDIGINPPSSVFRCGRRVETEYLPTKLRPDGRKRSLPDFVQVGMGQACSERFREIVEELEPGVHQFEPVEMVWKDGATAGPYFWFIPCQRLDTLYLEFLNPPIKETTGKWSNVIAGKGRVKDARLVFSQEKIGNHQVWCDMRMDGYIVISDQAAETFEQKELVGIKIIKQETL